MHCEKSGIRRRWEVGGSKSLRVLEYIEANVAPRTAW